MKERHYLWCLVYWYGLRVLLWHRWRIPLRWWCYPTGRFGGGRVYKVRGTTKRLGQGGFITLYYGKRAGQGAKIFHIQNEKVDSMEEIAAD